MIMPVLSVKDVDASIAFYTEKLGFQATMKIPGSDGNTAFAFVQLGKAVFGLSLDTDVQPGERVAPGVQFMVYVAEDTDIDAYYADVKAKGAAIMGELDTAYWGDRIFSLHDPDGYFLTMAKTVRDVPPEEIGRHLRDRG